MFSIINYAAIVITICSVLYLPVDLKQAESLNSNKGTIAFGSCSKATSEQPLWPQIIDERPSLWIWLGDNIYGDTNDMAILANKYQVQRQQKAYIKLKDQVEVIGTWDDHDYGINDGGKGYVQKKESQRLMLDFLEEPENSPRRKQEGIYTAYNRRWNKVNVKIILLDTRYHRDTIHKTQNGYQPNNEGTILGGKQWQWLESALMASKADINIIASSIQVIPTEHRFEKWANFPKERTRLFELISRSKAKGVILISGDRHIAEVSKIDIEGMNYPLYEVTSSGLTHTWKNTHPEANTYREGPLMVNKNYGVFKVAKKKRMVTLEALVKGENNQTLFSKIINFE